MANLLLNSDFEDSTGDNFAFWTEVVSGSATITAETSDVFRGSQSIKFTPDGTENCYVTEQQNPCEVGQEYTVTFWAKGTAAGAKLKFTQPFYTGEVALTTDWKQYSFTDIADYDGVTISRSTVAAIPFIVDHVRVVPTLFKHAVIYGTLSDDIASPDTDFTLADFGTPKAAIVLMSNATVASNPNSDAGLTVGFWDGTDQHCRGLNITDALDTSDDFSILKNDKIVEASTSSTTHARYVASGVTDGLRITMDYDNTALSRYATVILFNGADVEAKVGTASPASPSGAYATESGVGFRPDLVFFSSVNNFVGHNTNLFNCGAALRYGLENRAVMLESGWGTDTTGNITFVTDNECIGSRWNNVYSEISKFTADGFTLLTSVDGSYDAAAFLALKMPGTVVKLDTLTSPSGIGTDAITGVGFKPETLIVVQSSSSTLNDKVGWDIGLSGSVGVAIASQESSMSVRSAFGVDISDADSLWSENVINVRDSANGSSHTTATVESFDDDGFTLNYTAGSGITQGWYLAFADVAVNKKIVTLGGS